MRFSNDEPRYSRFAARSKAQQKRIVLYVVLLVAIVIAMYALRGKSHARTITWVGSFQEARTLAQAEGKPIMAYFYTAGSDDCRRMDQGTFTDPTVVTESRLFVCVAVDGPANPELAKRYLAIAYPSVAFIGPGGERLPTVLGYRTPEQTVDWMQDALQRLRLSTITDGETLPPRNAEPARGETE